MPPLSFITPMKRSAKPNTTCSGGFAAPSVAAYRPQTVPDKPATAAPPQKPYFSSSSTRAPAFAAVNAAATPAAPPPTTSTSVSRVNCARRSLFSAIGFLLLCNILEIFPDRCQQGHDSATLYGKPTRRDSGLPSFVKFVSR